MSLRCIKNKNFGVGCILEIHFNEFSRLQLIGLRYFTGNFEFTRPSATNFSMYVLCLVIELFVSKKARVYTSFYICTCPCVSRLLTVFFANTNFDTGTDPLILFVRFNLNKEKPLFSFHLLGNILRDFEGIFASKKILGCQLFLVWFVKFEILVLLGCNLKNKEQQQNKCFGFHFDLQIYDKDIKSMRA